ncbi:hypothetical protein GCM10008908_31180 [Clostridium subterminale]|uniref:Uncharacterized protein n=1 Tax=Clostridium subterminale TaxID=1550 RepID=A0ABN1KVE0_CLOSU
MSTIPKTDIDNTTANINFKTIDTSDKNVIKDEIIKASETGLVNRLNIN